MSVQPAPDAHPGGAARVAPWSRRRRLPPADEKAIASLEPQALCRALEQSDRFRRDTPLGGIFHCGRVSYRELTPTDSLHIIVRGNRVSAHVDAVCPLEMGEDGSARYSLSRVLAHNLAVLRADLARLLRGRRGRVRCNMECEVVWVHDNDGAGAPEAADAC